MIHLHPIYMTGYFGLFTLLGLTIEASLKILGFL